MARGSHGLGSSKSPMNISYRRSTSAPCSLMTSSGLTPFSIDFAIFSTETVSVPPVAFRCALSPRYSTSRVLVVAAHGVLVGLGQHRALVAQLLERLLGADVPQVVQHLVPEARVQQVQHRVFGAADVQVDGHPLLLVLLGPGHLVVLRRPGSAGSTSTIPPTGAWCWSRAWPGHRNAGRWCSPTTRWPPAAIHPCPSARTARRPAARTGRSFSGTGTGPPHFVAVDDGDGLAPVALAREHPVAQPVADRELALAAAPPARR